MSHALEAENLQLWRGERQVLRGVGFSLAGGECLQVRGANGAGKTTLLRAACGLLYPEAGRILWDGVDVRADPAAFHARLVYLGHEPPLKADLSARENLRYWIGVRQPDHGLDGAGGPATGRGGPLEHARGADALSRPTTARGACRARIAGSAAVVARRADDQSRRRGAGARRQR